ncbi:MAG: hypothetical protein R3F20_13075 [Planctomycetota bacterium]
MFPSRSNNVASGRARGLRHLLADLGAGETDHRESFADWILAAEGGQDQIRRARLKREIVELLGSAPPPRRAELG